MSQRIVALGALGLILVAGCGSSPTLNENKAIVPGTVTATTNPLVAMYSIAIPQGAQVEVNFGPDTTYGLSTSSVPAPAGGGPVSIEVGGMRQNTTYHMQAVVTLADGSEMVDPDHSFATGAVPAGVVPQFTVTPTPGATPEPGIEFMNTILGPVPSNAFATDLDGNIIWYYQFPDRQSDTSLAPIKMLPNGHLMAILAPPSFFFLTSPPTSSTLNVLREIDLVGNTVQELSMTTLNARLAAANFAITLGFFSHDFALLPNGHVLVIATVAKTFNDLPGYSGPTEVLGDAVVDLDTNMQPVWVWNEFDHLDVNRRSYQFPDWTHSNALAYSKDDGNFLISIRNQNWVVKVDYRDGAGTGKIVWKLGQGGDFKLQGAVDPTDWFYAQHDVNFVSPNTTGIFQVALMDNGNNRLFPSGLTCGSTGAPACYTTIPVMQIDERAMTASFLFHKILPPEMYSYFAGGTNVLKNGNIHYALATSTTGGYVDEVSPGSMPLTVWQMNMPTEQTYRSERIPSLYPGVQW